MQRVRKIIENDGLIVLEVDKYCNQQRGGSNAMYLLDYFEFGQHEHDAAIGRAVRERAEDILDGRDEPEPVQAEGDEPSEVQD